VDTKRERNMPQSAVSAKQFVGSKSNLNCNTHNIDWKTLRIDEQDRKAIEALGGDVRVPRTGRGIAKELGNNILRLYHELKYHERYDLRILRMQDAQLVKLTEVLKLGFIWGLNIGELSRVSKKGWIKFTKQLAQTNVTHMYASENTLLTPKMKIAMMDVIRENRKADKRHCNKDNKDIINAVTNMWFNPKRSKKYQKQFQTAKEGADCAKSSGM
jgi:hypothetical protein